MIVPEVDFAEVYCTTCGCESALQGIDEASAKGMREYLLAQAARLKRSFDEDEGGRYGRKAS
jgi:hypothetical protein